MLEKFINYYRDKLQIHQSDSVLLTISGGVDSMVMLKLFQESGFPFAGSLQFSPSG